MASFEITWKGSAKRELRKLPMEARRRIIEAVEQLQLEPHPTGSRKISWVKDAYRIRIGPYRVIYSVLAAVLVIEVLRVGDRKDVYRRRS